MQAIAKQLGGLQPGSFYEEQNEGGTVQLHFLLGLRADSQASRKCLVSPSSSAVSGKSLRSSSHLLLPGMMS
jgi:hypothetical protein